MKHDEFMNISRILEIIYSLEWKRITRIRKNKIEKKIIKKQKIICNYCSVCITYIAWCSRNHQFDGACNQMKEEKKLYHLIEICDTFINIELLGH